jgi:flagellar basal-body rod protein FlgB
MPTQVFSALSSRMDYLIARQGVIASNIANADTPGYLAKDIGFAPRSGSSFAMRVTNAKHLGSSSAGGGGSVGRVTEDSRFIQHNGNSVRQDIEAIKQNQTSLDYRMMTQLYSGNMQLQRLAIGRGQ